MKNIAFFFIIIASLSVTNIHAQNGNGLSIDEQKKTIIFLMNNHEIDSEDTIWSEYLNSIYYKRIFKNKNPNNNEIYIFKSKSPHASPFLLFKKDSVFKIIDNISHTENINFMLDFFKNNTNINSKNLLATISKIIEVYQSNLNTNYKIPQAQE